MLSVSQRRLTRFVRSHLELSLTVSVRTQLRSSLVSNNIYSVINLLPGTFDVFARTVIGNELEDYGRQTVSIEGGHQYVFRFDCANLKFEISQGQLKSAIDYLGEYNMYYNARTKVAPFYYHHNGKLNLAKLDF